MNHFLNTNALVIEKDGLSLMPVKVMKDDRLAYDKSVRVAQNKYASDIFSKEAASRDTGDKAVGVLMRKIENRKINLSCANHNGTKGWLHRGHERNSDFGIHKGKRGNDQRFGPDTPFVCPDGRIMRSVVLKREHIDRDQRYMWWNGSCCSAKLT